jgi:hypothetical protein
MEQLFTCVSPIVQGVALHAHDQPSSVSIPAQQISPSQSGCDPQPVKSTRLQMHWPSSVDSQPAGKQLHDCPATGHPTAAQQSVLGYRAAEQGKWLGLVEPSSAVFTPVQLHSWFPPRLGASQFVRIVPVEE